MGTLRILYIIECISLRLMGLIDLKFVLAGLLSCFKVLHLNYTIAPVCRWENPSTASKTYD